MDPSRHARLLCLYGVILFFLGLLNGGVVSVFSNPRMGLSAHLAAVQSGMALLLFGLLWPRLSLADVTQRIASWACILSMYAIWVALLLAAIFGTSDATPIAGSGFHGARWQESLVTAILYPGSAGSIAGVALILLGFRNARFPSG
jgi:hydroxylaminobenzene mutase